jgi:hypothetical protein
VETTVVATDFEQEQDVAPEDEPITAERLELIAEELRAAIRRKLEPEN